LAASARLTAVASLGKSAWNSRNETLADPKDGARGLADPVHSDAAALDRQGSGLARDESAAGRFKVTLGLTVGVRYKPRR